ncbi:MAG TPA: ATP phosphoribosyltransferase [Thermomicrobiales bacterium]|jgi:ATP phosphoribosyltransferase|nr:ATP phosphoribosyltransferase [Thermomicrobiales bacterium]
MTSARSLIQGDNRLKLAMQRKGRLTDHSIGLLRQIGLSFESYGQRLFSQARNFPLSILYARDDDIPDYVQLETVDLGIVGRNLVHEQNADVVEISALGFGYCELVVAVPNDSDYERPQDLNNARLATSYPESARRFYESIGGSPDIIQISGSVEVAPALGVADAIVELTATGSSLQLNDLRPIHTILESEAVLIANRAALENPAKRENIERLKMRIEAVDAAKKHKYIMMNAPEKQLAEIRKVLPGLKSPTVVPLADPGWVAIHTAIEEDEFWDKIEQLRSAGASEILVSSLDKLLL